MRAGARFLQLQVSFEPERLAAFMNEAHAKRLSEHCAMLPSICLVRSPSALRYMNEHVPGIVVPIHFTATKTGKYELVCTQLCGLGHYNMRAYVEVVTEPEFQQWLQDHASE